MAPINREDVIQILKMVNESQIDEFHLETGDFKLIVKKEGNTKSVGEVAVASEKPTPSIAVGTSPTITKVKEPEVSKRHSPERDVQRPEPVLQFEDKDLMPIRAPMLGVFYRAPKPGAPPFVEVGHLVANDDVVCIVEVMKLFNMVRAGIRGRIVKICAENAQLVEYNQVLFLVEKVDG